MGTSEREVICSGMGGYGCGVGRITRHLDYNGLGGVVTIST
jgi:hypothetical protein